MSRFYRLRLLIVRNTYHSLCLFILTFFFSSFGFIGVVFENIVDYYQEQIIQDIGYALSLIRTDDQSIPNNALYEISNTPGVSGLNAISYTLASPIDFSNYVYQNLSTSFSQIKSGQVKLVGNLNANQNITLLNKCQLVSGIYPDAERPGLVICDNLADYNNLSIGDHITLSCDGHSKISSEIVGIYHLLSPIMESVISDSGYEVYGNSPYSYIFCDSFSYKLFTGSMPSLTSVSIYASNMSDLSHAYQDLSKNGFNSGVYLLSNMTKSRIEIGTNTSRGITSLARLFMRVSIVMSIASVLLIMILWLRNNYQEAAILISLGESRLSVILDYYILISLIIILALLSSGFLWAVLISNYGDTIVQYALTVTRDTSISETDMYIQTAMSQFPHLTNYMYVGTVMLVTSWIATFFASFEIIRCNPQILFRSE